MLRDKKMIKKIAIAILLVILFTFTVPVASHASSFGRLII